MPIPYTCFCQIKVLTILQLKIITFFFFLTVIDSENSQLPWLGSLLKMLLPETHNCFLYRGQFYYFKDVFQLILTLKFENQCFECGILFSALYLKHGVRNIYYSACLYCSHLTGPQHKDSSFYVDKCNTVSGLSGFYFVFVWGYGSHNCVAG